jgi:hypothetical protein
VPRHQRFALTNFRHDSGFCREELTAWCETNHVDYVFGLAAISVWP